MLLKTHSGRDILRIMGEVPAGSRNDDRYWYSEKINSNMHYWATVTPRSKHDHIGVQLCGAVGQLTAKRLEPKLEAHGFSVRKDARSLVTFAKAIEFGGDGSPDVELIKSAKLELDSILFEQLPFNDVTKAHESSQLPFGQALRASLPFFVDLELPPRDGYTNDESLF